MFTVRTAKLILPIRNYTRINNQELINKIRTPIVNNVNKTGVIITKKITELNDKYINIIGLAEIKRMQDRVIVMQDNLLAIQDVRRDLSRQLNENRTELNNLQEQLHKINRFNERTKFIELTSYETEIINKGNELSREFEEVDKNEREKFTALSNAIRDCHEKERAQTEYTKYWGLILSICGTLIGMVFTMILNLKRNKELVTEIVSHTEKDIINIIARINKVDTKVQNVDNKMSSCFTQLENIISNSTKKVVEPKIKEIINEEPRSYRWYLQNWTWKQAGVVALGIVTVKLIL